MRNKSHQEDPALSGPRCFLNDDAFGRVEGGLLLMRSFMGIVSKGAKSAVHIEMTNKDVDA